ncbi:VOC family protein [Pedobacter mucosus]|uniref:VOC family protein n=1 Tax=Pedobacter mucosus TaxID=2895286 RepID=UPI001EE3BDAB|nr:VOC family protein [Pedobacter mucosus]UKT65320.1 extradiol dioxygenase [Pedobacter mucosus]
MTKSIWINLPVKDIAKSKNFFLALGFKLNLEYGSREDSACILIGESNFVIMLFEESLYESFVDKKLAENKSGTEVLFSFDAESVEEVNEMAEKVVAAGGTLYGKPGYKDGWMYGFGFIDLDGQRWNMLYMDMTKVPLG